MPVGPTPGARRRPPRRRPGIRRDPPERSGHRPLDCQRMGGRPFLFVTLSARLWRLRSLRAAGRYELARATLLRLTPTGSPEGDMDDDIFVDCGPDIGGCTIDLHKNFDATAYMPPVETLHARSTPAKAGSADIRLLAFEDHLRFVIMHLLKHGAWRPSGLCDVAAMVEAVPPDFDWDLCLGTTKWPPDGSARRSCSRIGCWDAVSTRRRRPCEPILPHGSSARFCANGRRPMPGDS